MTHDYAALQLILGVVVTFQQAVPPGLPQHGHGKADQLSNTGKVASNPRR